MKIIKIAQGNEYQMVPQDPNGQNNPDVQQQNLQNAQSAINYFKGVIEAATQAESALRNLEDTMGTELNLASQFQNIVRQAAASSSAYNLLAQMNFVSSVDNILDVNQMSQVESLISNNIASIGNNVTTETY